MQIQTVQIDTLLLEEFIIQLKKRFQFKYENSSEDMYIMVSEDNDFLFNRVTTNLIIAKKTDSQILVDIIGGKGQAYFITNFYSDPFIRLALVVIADCCQNMQWAFKPIENPSS